MRCRTICSDRFARSSLTSSHDRLIALSPLQLRVASMAPSYSLKKSHLPGACAAACGVARSQPVTHLIKDLEVDNPREELTLAQRYGLVCAI